MFLPYLGKNLIFSVLVTYALLVSAAFLKQDVIEAMLQQFSAANAVLLVPLYGFILLVVAVLYLLSIVPVSFLLYEFQLYYQAKRKRAFSTVEVSTSRTMAVLFSLAVLIYSLLNVSNEQVLFEVAAVSGALGVGALYFNRKHTSLSAQENFVGIEKS